MFHVKLTYFQLKYRKTAYILMKFKKHMVKLKLLVYNE